MPPPEQRFAAGDFVAAQIDQRLIVKFKAAIGKRCPQIMLELAAQIGLRLHRRLEEAIGPAAGRLGGVHRKVGALEQAEQIGAVARRNRDPDRGVAGKAVAMAIERRPQRLINPRDQRVDVVVGPHVALHDGEFVAAEPRDKIAGTHRLEQPRRDALQELVADQMAQRVVDALEFVDVDIDDRKRRLSGLRQQPFGVALEQRAVRQIGQRVVMSEMLDLGRHAPVLGDILQRGGPAAVGRTLVDQPEHASVRCRNHGIMHLVIRPIEEFCAIGIDVADERAQLLTMEDQVAQMASGLCHVRRQAEHVDIALVADHQPGGRIEQQQALRHVVDGGVEMLALFREQPLRHQVLVLQLTDDEEDHDDDHDDRKRRGAELQLGLRAPVGQGGRRLGGRDDQDREMSQRPDRADLVLAFGLADEAAGNVAVERQCALERRRGGNVAGDEFVVIRIAGDNGAVAVDHRDRGVAVERQRRHERLKMGRLDASAGEADDLAAAIDDLAGEHRGPFFRHLAHDRLDDDVGRRPAGGEFAEIAAVRDADVRHRPHLGRVDQPAFRIEQIERADVRKRGEPGAQHLMRAQGRHLLLEGIGVVEPPGLHVADDVVVDVLEIAELLVEMTRQQQRRVVQVAFRDLKRTFAELLGEIGGAKRNRHHQRDAAQDQPLDRAHSGTDQRDDVRQQPASGEGAVR